MRVSIHVCTKDRHSEVYGLLVCLWQQSFNEWDLVLVDGSMPHPCWLSHDGCSKMVNQLRLEGHGVHLVRPELPGVIYARNKAIDEDPWPENELILRIDDDSLIDSQFLWYLTNAMIADKSLGAVGCIVPNFGQPEFMRQHPLGVFDRVDWDNEGNISLSDNGGYSYPQEKGYRKDDFFDKINCEFISGDMGNYYVFTHHCRSSFLIRRKALEDIKLCGKVYSDEYGLVGFREETDICLRMAYAGWKLAVMPELKCWHLRTQSGGCRYGNYAEQVQDADNRFRTKFKNKYLKDGNPFEVKA